MVLINPSCGFVPMAHPRFICTSVMMSGYSAWQKLTMSSFVTIRLYEVRTFLYCQILFCGAMAVLAPVAEVSKRVNLESRFKKRA